MAGEWKRKMYKRWTGIILPFLLLLFMAVWMSGDHVIQTWKSIQAELEHEYFAVGVFDEKGNKKEIECWQNPYEGDYFLFLPSYGLNREGVFCFNQGESLLVNGKRFEDGNVFCDVPLNQKCNFEMQRNDGSQLAGEITFMNSGQLPALFVDTASGNMEAVHQDREYRESGVYFLVPADGCESIEGKLEYIKGRGNATWEWGKKPYSIKLDRKEDLLGMGEAKSWILLANYLDGSYIRNKIVYDLADDIGLAYSPESEFVDLYLNGYYAGLYQLTEKVEIGNDRVNIPGGYLMEWDITERYTSEKNGFITDRGQAVVIKEPSKVSEERAASLHEFVQEFEDALYAEDGRNPYTGKAFFEYIDLQSWAKKYLIEEVSKNFDSGITSQYFYRAADTEGDFLLYAGPVWDYDYALGNGDWSIRKPEGMYANQDIRMYNPQKGENVFRNRWFPQLYEQDIFLEEVVSQYQEQMLPAVTEMLTHKIDKYGMEIQMSAEMDRCRWNGEPVIIKKVYKETLGEQIEYIKDFLRERILFLNTVWIDKVDYCTVCFHTEYATRNIYFSVERNKLLEKAPSYEESFGGMVFDGWYYDEEYTQPFDIEAVITEDTDVYAKWIPE